MSMSYAKLSLIKQHGYMCMLGEPINKKANELTYHHMKKKSDRGEETIEVSHR